MIEECKNAKNYKGLVDPTCDDQHGCAACWSKRLRCLKRKLKAAIRKAERSLLRDAS